MENEWTKEIDRLRAEHAALVEACESLVSRSVEMRVEDARAAIAKTGGE